MFSIKDAVRKTVITVSLAALTTSFFTGCSQQPTVSSNDLYPTTSEVTTQYTDDINPGDKDTNHDANTFSIKYKYWYDNPDVKETQDKALVEADPGGDNPNGETFLGLAGLPLYTDPSGNQYIISGRTVCYLADGKISPIDSYFLRDTNGNKIYTLVDMTKEDFAKYRKEFDVALSKTDRKQAADYNERINSDSDVTNSEQLKELYINNIKVYDVDHQAITVSNTIGLNTIFATVNNGLTEQTDTGYKITLFTAAGLVEITATETADNRYELTYSTGIDKVITAPDELTFADTNAILTLSALEDYLGFDVETYDDFINIVTDNKDIVSPDSAVTLAELDQNTDVNMNPDISNLDPENPMPVSKPASEHESTEPEKKPETQAKPADNKTPDGKYDLAATDIINPDGTYSSELKPGVTNPGDGFVLDADTIEWLNTCGKGQSNPANIPYSDITVDNAAEAFPYLGWYGSIPGYFEVEPGMTEAQIREVIIKNFNGLNYGTDHSITKDNSPRFFFKSEAEYNEYLAEEQAKIAAIEASDQEMREHRQKVLDGEEKIGDGFSQEQLDDFFSGR